MVSSGLQRSPFAATSPIFRGARLEGLKSSLSYGEQLEEDIPKVILPWQVPITRSFRPLVILFYGRRGKGKTLAMTSFAGFLGMAYLANHIDFQIVSNYQVDFADFCNPYLIDELIEYPEWAWRKLVLIDEAAASFPSRRSMANNNVMFSNFLTQIRKRAIEVMFTTQFPQVLDTQVLLQLDLAVECETVGNPPEAVNFFYHDFWGQWTGKNWRKTFPPEPGTHDWEGAVLGVRSVLGRYRTEEVIAPIQAKFRDLMLQREGWRENTAEDGLETESRPIKLPETIEELLAMQGESFMADAVLHLAKRLDGRVKNARTFAQVLKEHGYRVYNDDVGITIAEKV